jgi:hypothetical protein
VVASNLFGKGWPCNGSKGEEHMTDYTDYETQREILIEYLHVMIARCDWHGVADVAMDLRELEAEHKEKP